MSNEQIKVCIEEAIYEYKKEDPMNEETLARIEELEWVLVMLSELE